MLKEHSRVLAKTPEVVTPLMGPHLTKLEAVLEPGVCMLTWTSLNLNTYVDSVYETLGEVELMIDRVNDTIEFRIEKVLEEISQTKLVELPTDTPWTIEKFLKKTQVIVVLFSLLVSYCTIYSQNNYQKYFRISTKILMILYPCEKVYFVLFHHLYTFFYKQLRPGLSTKSCLLET